MKQILADFEQLEQDIEARTGKELYLESDCFSVGKFATSYACSLDMQAQNEWEGSITKLVNSSIKTKFEEKECTIASEVYRLTNKDENSYECVLTVRGSNKSDSRKIFSKYFIN